MTAIVARQEELQSAGLTGFDAYHLVAWAERLKADFLITADDRFAHRAERVSGSVRVIDPLTFVEEFCRDDSHPAELRWRGLQVLIRELGYADAMRCMLQFGTGRPGSDYARDRDAFLPFPTGRLSSSSSSRRN